MPGKKTVGGFKTKMAFIGISVNIPTKAFCHPFCFLLVCSESCFYTFGRIDRAEISTYRRWAGLDYKSATGDPPFLVQNEWIACHLITS